MAKNQKDKSATPLYVDKVDELLEFIEDGTRKKPAKKTKPKPTVPRKARAKR